MPDSHSRASASRYRAALVCAALSLAAGIGAVQAQAPQPGPPIPLIPQASVLAQASPSVPPPPGPPGPALPGTVVAAPLAALNPDELGALPDGVSALPKTLWDGTGRPVVDALLGQLQPTTSPTLEDLAFRLLASPATAPAGDVPPGALAAVRAEQLSAFGHPDAALQLVRALPPQQLAGDAAQVLVELLFLTQDSDHACAEVKSRDPSWQGVFWDQAAVTCNLLGGQTAPAQIGLDMLSEEGGASSGFSALVSRAAGFDVPMPQELPPPQPLSLALLAKAAKGLPPSILTNGGLAVLRAVALAPQLPEEARLIAAEKAGGFGAVSPDQLAAAYLALPLDPDERSQPMNAALHEEGVRARAILFDAAHDATDPGARAQYLAVFFEKASGAGIYPAAIRAAQPMLLAIPPAPDLAADAIDMARALYALDLPDAARPWFDLLPPGGQQQFLPLAMIVGGGKAPGWSNAVLLAANPTGDPDAAAIGRAGLACQLLAALGRPAPNSAILQLLAAGGTVTWDMPAAGPPALLATAAAQHQVGGTILAILASLGSPGAAAPAPLVIASVAALHQLGMDNEARHLAIDAAIAAGL